MLSTGRHGLALALLLALLGCDGLIRARVRVLSTQGPPVADALLRLQEAGDHDWARFTDSDGCAYFSGVLPGPARHVRASVGKPGFESRSLDLSIAREECFVIRLAEVGGGQGSVDSLALDACPCSSHTGYSPTLAARFKVTSPDGAPVAQVGLRRSDRPPNPWVQVSDAAGCLGIKWIVGSGLSDIPLVLEKAGYEAAPVTVPTMKELCYAATLSQTGSGHPSTVVPIVTGSCECEMFSGKTVWPER